MNINFKLNLGGKLQTELGKGVIIMVAVDEEGPKYLLDHGERGKEWITEAKAAPGKPEKEQQQKPQEQQGAAAVVVMLILLLTLILAPGAMAQTYTATDGYVTAVQNAPLTNYSEVVFSGSPEKSIRLTSIDYRSDTNTAMFHLYGGTAPYPVTGVINGTNLVVPSNAGIVTNQLAILQIGGTNWTAMILYTNQLTNVVLAGGATLGFTPLTNSILWHCGQRVLFPVNVSTGQRIGDAVFAGQVRAPVAVRLDPGVVTSNKLAVTAYYGTVGSP